MRGYTTSVTLLNSLGEDDYEAWCRFVALYKPYIFSLLRKFNISLEDKEDLFQMVSAKIWKSFEGNSYTRGRAKFRTWMAIVTKNQALNYLKLKSNRIKNLIVEDSIEHLSDLSCEDSSYEEDEWRLFVSKIAWEKVQNLHPPKHLRIFVLKMEGKSAMDISNMLNLTTNSVHVYFKKVKMSMQREVRYLNYTLDLK